MISGSLNTQISITITIISFISFSLLSSVSLDTQISITITIISFISFSLLSSLRLNLHVCFLYLGQLSTLLKA